MRYGFVLPGGSAREQIEQAVLAEAAGWDGVFVWEAAYGLDAWSLLAAMAERTSRVRLGTMLTPLPWRRPWKVASQAATVDELSGGRAILAVGLGAPGLGEWREVAERRERAERLDEGIDLITTLWEGGLRYEGRQFGADLTERPELASYVTVVQQPRIPIWVVGVWPRPKSMRRVLRCDGLLPVCMERQEIRRPTPDDIRAMIAWLDAHGGRRPGFDLVMDGETPADDAAASIVRPLAEAGATWWLDTRWGSFDSLPQRVRATTERLHAGPPKG